MDGKLTGKLVRDSLKQKLKDLKLKSPPKLAIVAIEPQNASKIYIRNKIKAAENIGISAELYESQNDERGIIKLIEKLNNDAEVSGIIVQLPIPKNLNKFKIINSIAPTKDVDGLTYDSLGRLICNTDTFIPCTTLGIITLLNQYNIPIQGKNVVILGRSEIVGKPTAQALLNLDATVTILHSKSNNIKEHTQKADILIVAIGKSKFINKEYIKDNCVVIDVGINYNNENIEGDVDFNDVLNKASHVTPVPGGVGRMTVAMLMSNVVKAYIQQKNMFAF